MKGNEVISSQMNMGTPLRLLFFFFQESIINKTKGKKKTHMASISGILNENACLARYLRIF